MTSEIFRYIGIDTIDPAIWFIILAGIIIILILLLIIQMVRFSKFRNRIDKFLKVKNVNSLEDDVTELFEDNKYIMANTNKNKNDLEIVSKRINNCLRKKGIVKYDAFEQLGGSLSYAVALLDSNDTGFIINSVHSVEGCYSYIKEVEKGVCGIDLGKEEQQALEIALHDN